MRLPFIEIADYKHKEYRGAIIRVGNDNGKWRRRIDVSVSPTGKSVRIWVDGKEIVK